MAIPISHEECWNRLQRLGVEHQAMKYGLDESAAELDHLRAVNAELLEALRGLMKGYERRLGDWENANFNSEWNVAVSAIAKVEGKTE